MNKNYSVPHLTSSTSEKDRKKLKGALQAVPGVESVVLKPTTHQFEISGKSRQEPKAADISAASAKAGFKIDAGPAKKEKR